MEIKKQYDIGAIANEIKDRIIISSNGEVCIDVLLAQNIVDVLEEIGRMEKEGNKGKTVIDRLSPASPSQDGNKKAPENLKNGCDDKPECYGKYLTEKEQERDCTHCPDEVHCYFETEKTEEDKTEEKPMLRQCTNCLMKDKGCNRDCKNNRITAKMLRDRTGCFGDYDSTDGACGKCKYLELCKELRAKREPCFGCYDDENFDSDCPECEYSIVCREATNNA